LQFPSSDLYYFSIQNDYLRSASEQGQRIWVQQLLQKGADVNSTDKLDHKTALEKAVSQGHQHIVEVLLPKASPPTIEAALKLSQQMKERSVIFLAILQGRQNKDVKIESVSTAGGGTNEEQSVFLDEKLLVLERENERVKAEFEKYKREQATQTSELLSQTQRLTEELNQETESRKEMENAVLELEKEMQIRNMEISSVKIERDTERRAKENAKRILSLDSLNMPPAPPNNLSKPKLTKATSSISIGSKEASPAGFLSLPPSTQSVTRELKVRDDMEQVMENQVKSRVRRLVRRWEDMKSLP